MNNTFQEMNLSVQKHLSNLVTSWWVAEKSRGVLKEVHSKEEVHASESLIKCVVENYLLGDSDCGSNIFLVNLRLRQQLYTLCAKLLCDSLAA